MLGREVIDRSLISVMPDGNSGSLKIDAGRLHGLSTDSILAVHPPPGANAGDESGSPVGYVRITDVDVATARVTPCEYAGVARPRRQAIVGGRCEIAELDYGEMKLRVAVDGEDAEGNAAPPSALRTLQTYLQELAAEQGALVAAVDDLQKADWLLSWHAGYVYLVPATNPVVSPESHSTRDTNLRLFQLGSMTTAAQEKEGIGSALHRVAPPATCCTLPRCPEIRQQEWGPSPWSRRWRSDC